VGDYGGEEVESWELDLEGDSEEREKNDSNDVFFSSGDFMWSSHLMTP